MLFEKKPKFYKGVYCVLTALFLFSVPSSSNYMLKSYELDGSGGTGQSANYKSETDTAPLGGEQKSATYSVDGGLIFTQQANVSTGTLTNGGNWYNKLLLTLNPQNNPSDTQFAVAISTDDFATTQYIQQDGTIGSALGSEDWQTFTAWGGGSGTEIIGLMPGTTYKIKIKSRQGDFTEGPYGPIASGTTDNSTLSFDIDISSSDSETSAPYNVSLGSLTPGSIVAATDRIWVDLDTNAENGGFIYIFGTYGGLRSANVSYTITSQSTNLSSASEGYGVRSFSATNLIPQSPYNAVGGQVVGVVDSVIRPVYTSNNAPVSSGRGSLRVLAKSSNTTPAANDYVDTLTVIATGSF